MNLEFVLACLGKQTAATEMLQQQLTAAQREIEALRAEVAKLQPVSSEEEDQP